MSNCDPWQFMCCGRDGECICEERRRAERARAIEAAIDAAWERSQ